MTNLLLLFGMIHYHAFKAETVSCPVNHLEVVVVEALDYIRWQAFLIDWGSMLWLVDQEGKDGAHGSQEMEKKKDEAGFRVIAGTEEREDPECCHWEAVYSSQEAKTMLEDHSSGESCPCLTNKVLFRSPVFEDCT